MTKNFTLKDLTTFAAKEDIWRKQVLGSVHEEIKPKESVVSAILNYSKSLSVRDSEIVDKIEVVLN